jgi:hypothetical protein
MKRPGLAMLGVAILTGIVMFGTATPAQAGFKMTISDGSTTTTVNDNSGLDANVNSGQIVFIGSVGVFNINISVGTSNAPGTSDLAQMTINNVSISALGFSGNKTLTITLEDNGFTAPTGQATMESQLSSTQVPGGSNITFQSFFNNSPGTLLSLNAVGGVQASDHLSISSTPYTLMNVTTYNVQGRGTPLAIQATGITTVHLPAPAGLVLALTGLPMLGGLALLRRRKAAVAI